MTHFRQKITNIIDLFFFPVQSRVSFCHIVLFFSINYKKMSIKVINSYFFLTFIVIVIIAVIFHHQFEEDLLGIHHIYDPFSLTVLSKACHENIFFQDHHQEFRLDRKHDYPFDRFREQQDDDDVTWAQLAVVARRHLSRFNHSLVSSKALLASVLGHLQSTTFLASSALPRLEEVEDALRRAREVGGGDQDLLLIVKAANQVQGAGQAVLPSSMRAEDALRLINETAFNGGRAIDAAFHLHGVPNGFVLMQVWNKSFHQLSSSEPLLPRVARWIRGKKFRSPYEFKVVLVWGKAVIAHTHSIPGCRYVVIESEAYECAGSPALTQSLWRRHAENLVRLSEKIARVLGNSWCRVDWFVSHQNGEFVLNEIEQIEGTFSLLPSKRGDDDDDEWSDVEKCMAQLWLRGNNKKIVVVDRTDEEVAAELKKITFLS